MLYLYPFIHEGAGDEFIPVAGFIASFATHNGQTATFGFPFQPFDPVSVERCFCR